MFKHLAADLSGAGHRVLIAELTGLGSRQDEFHPGITLTTHIDDVTAQIAEAGYNRFVLVDHSWGGMVITGVAPASAAGLMRWPILMPSCPKMASRCGT